MISIIILTHNEQNDLPGCLSSVAWSDDIHVLDSGSSDATLDIARSAGARITHRPFDTFAAQRNAGMALPFRHPWVLVLDADERPTPELSAEIQRLVPTLPASVSGLRMRRRDFLWGTWLKHAQMTPFYIRLLRVGHATYTRDINEVVTVTGDILDLRHPLDHHPFSKGISDWVARHNAYSTREACLLASGEATRSASLRRALFASDFHERRVAQKAFFYKLPLRPFIKWTYLMFFRGAILDGHAGLMYSTLLCFYEYLIEVKRRELQRQTVDSKQ